MVALVFGVASPKRWTNIDIGLSEQKNRTGASYKERRCLPRSSDELMRLMDSHFLSDKMAMRLPRGPDRGLDSDGDKRQRAGRRYRHIVEDDTDRIRTINEKALYSKETVDFKYPYRGGPYTTSDSKVGVPTEIDEIDHLKQFSSSGDGDSSDDTSLSQKLPMRRLLQRTKKSTPSPRRKNNKRRGRARTSIGKTDLEEPPWHCELKTEWVRMPTGYFPPYVHTGRCEQSNCMFGMYQCKPKHYVIRVLRRNPEQCNPLPVIGVNTTYEEAWDFAKYKITICCECSRSRQYNRRQGRRRKNKNKGMLGIGV